jgi:hypothetical protein
MTVVAPAAMLRSTASSMRLLVLVGVFGALPPGAVAADATPGSPPAAVAAPAVAAPAVAAAGGPRAAPLLDKAKGERAAAVYRAAFTRFCERAGTPGERAPDPASVGIVTADDMIDSLCRLKASPRALASGSFLRAGADEVLLEAESGVAAGRDSELLVMRADAQGTFRLQPWVSLGASFEAHARFVVDGRADVLFLCEPGGRQGVYPTWCGFFGQGQFAGWRPDQEEPDGDSPDDDLMLYYTTACGPSTAIGIQGASLIDGKIVVALEIEKVSRHAKGPDEGGDMCTAKKVGARWPVSVAYEVLPGRIHRTAPLPKRLVDALKNVDY